MFDTSIVKPKLTGEELQLLRKRLERRYGVQIAAEATGLHGTTIYRIALAGTGRDSNIKKIKEFITQPDPA